VSPIHIKAKRGNVADSVIMAGDPARVKRLADLLTHPRVVNKNRGFLVITGSRGGIDVTLAAPWRWSALGINSYGGINSIRGTELREARHRWRHSHRAW